MSAVVLPQPASVFDAILDSSNGGYFRIAPVDDSSPKQLYLPDTDVLITRFLSSSSVSELQEFMPVAAPGNGGHRRLIRRVVCLRGVMRFRLECEPRFNHGRDPHEVVIEAGGALFRSSSLSLALATRIPLFPTTAGVVAGFTLPAGQTATFVLEDASNGEPPSALSEAAARAAFDATVNARATRD